MIHVEYKKKQSSFEINIENTRFKSDGTPVPGLWKHLMEVWTDKQSFQHVRCTCSDFQKRLWCSHMDKLMTEDLDRKVLSAAIGVPMFNKPCLVIPCLVLPKANKPLAKVQVVWGDIQGGAGSVTASGEYTLGFIYRGMEGRATIRRLLADWLCVIPVQFPDSMECQQPQHRIGDSTLDRGTTLNGDPAAIRKAIMIDAFQLLDTKMCRKCADAIFIPQDPPF